MKIKNDPFKWLISNERGKGRGIIKESLKKSVEGFKMRLNKGLGFYLPIVTYSYSKKLETAGL